MDELENHMTLIARLALTAALEFRRRIPAQSLEVSMQQGLCALRHRIQISIEACFSDGSCWEIIII